MAITQYPQFSVTWLAVEKEKLISLTSAIYIKTDHNLGSSSSMLLNAYSSEGIIGSLEIKFYAEPRYSLSSCGFLQTFPTDIPSEKVKVWKVSKTDSNLTVRSGY